ncbi:MAG: GNAT family N-acetyltransferase [SAR324 cluster bacterium]|nr:GNAT family N-acetyltransferase [SAR324 cluster bacterium]
MNPFKIELLTTKHHKQKFDCGVKELNHYLQSMASQHATKGISRTFVLVHPQEPENILGFITLSICEINAQILPTQFAKKFPSKVPGAKIGRLAISRKHQRQGLGELLMLHAMNQTLLVHHVFGLTGVLVDAKHEQAQQYYIRYGFIPLPQIPLTLFLPIKTLLEAFK